MNMIEELYYGNINPNEKKFSKETQYAKAMEAFCKGEKTLEEILEGDTLKIFNNLMNANDEISACTSVEKFKIGFILGVRLMADCYNADIHMTFKDM